MLQKEYYVVTVTHESVGPISPDVISYLVKTWQIGPDSPIKMGEDGEWATMRDVGDALGIDLPDSENWKVNRVSALAKERKNGLLAVVFLLVLIWGGLTIIGLGFIFMPMLIVGALFVILCLIFTPIAGTDVLSAPMWTDIRKKPENGQGWQFLAFAIASILTMVFYAWRIYGR